jgi:hypothetical protein
VGGTLFFGAYDRAGDAQPEGIGAHPDLKLRAGTYRIVYFTDAPSKVSFAVIGTAARAATLRSWRTAADYKAIWQAFGPAGNGAVTFQQDLPLQLRKATIARFWIYQVTVGASVDNGQLCLLPHARRGTCGTTSDPDLSGGGASCCLYGWTMTNGVIYGRGYAPGAWDIEINNANVAIPKEAGLLALVKN